MSAPTIYCDLIKEQPTPRDAFMVDSYLSDKIVDDEYADYLADFQPWRILVLSGDNHEPLFRSTERYKDERDARRAIEIALGPNANVWIRQEGKENVPLRMALG